MIQREWEVRHLNEYLYRSVGKSDEIYAETYIRLSRAVEFPLRVSMLRDQHIERTRSQKRMMTCCSENQQ